MLWNKINCDQLGSWCFDVVASYYLVPSIACELVRNAASLTLPDPQNRVMLVLTY